MKKLLIALFGAALVLGACSGADADESEATDPQVNEQDEATEGDATPEEEVDSEETAGKVTGDFDTEKAEADYQKYQCLNCHGEDLNGGTQKAIIGYTKEQVLTAIKEGPGQMPTLPVSDEDADNLAAWIDAHNN